MPERRALESGDRLVVKIGSSSLAQRGGGIDPAAIGRIADHVCAQWELGHPTVLVTSGAVAAGSPALGGRPTELAGLQVAAAVGQVRLMERYGHAFSERGWVAGQVLLTKDILASRSQYLHARSALDRMLSIGVIPIVNENDTVAVEELRLGDNDRLAALVSHLVGAELLVLLTDTNGIYRNDPRKVDDAELLDAVRHTDEVLDEVARGGKGPLGSGGVATKVAAARMAAWSGVPTIIALAAEEDVVLRAARGEDVGTWVAPHHRSLSARKLWIAFGQPASGRITVDAGAADALCHRGSSLLAVGVVGCTGEFGHGDAVEVYTDDGAMIAKGVTAMDAIRTAAVMGRRTTELAEGDSLVIHRDNLVVLSG
ncbi:MAG: glutamate 5-kinase [Acidimicrobiia bacterium]|nr:glutamate 5-kinase [Acidimicrobiia bacterium]